MAPAKATHGSLILEVNTPEEANILIQKGFNFDLLVHPCEAYHQHLRIQQCFNCQAFGHQAKACKALTRCGRCAGEHQSKACPKTNPSKCGACLGLGHTSWSGQCPKKAAAQAKALTDRAAAPGFSQPSLGFLQLPRTPFLPGPKGQIPASAKH